jgi:uncharacterized membrane-anchored protein
MTVSMMLIPATINIALPAWLYLGIAGVGFGAKVYLKKKYHIVGGIL